MQVTDCRVVGDEAEGRPTSIICKFIRLFLVHIHRKRVSVTVEGSPIRTFLKLADGLCNGKVGGHDDIDVLLSLGLFHQFAELVPVRRVAQHEAVLTVVFVFYFIVGNCSSCHYGHDIRTIHLPLVSQGLCQFIGRHAGSRSSLSRAILLGIVVARRHSLISSAEGVAGFRSGTYFLRSKQAMLHIELVCKGIAHKPTIRIALLSDKAAVEETVLKGDLT